MSGVKRQKVFWDDGGETIKRFHEVDAVLASDYDKLACLVDPGHKLTMDAACGEIVVLEAERDELRAQVQAMRALLTDARRYVDKAWPDGVHSYRANSVSGDLLRKIDATLQPKP